MKKEESERFWLIILLLTLKYANNKETCQPQNKICTSYRKVIVIASTCRRGLRGFVWLVSHRSMFPDATQRCGDGSRFNQYTITVS